MLENRQRLLVETKYQPLESRKSRRSFPLSLAQGPFGLPSPLLLVNSVALHDACCCSMQLWLAPALVSHDTPLATLTPTDPPFSKGHHWYLGFSVLISKRGNTFSLVGVRCAALPISYNQGRKVTTVATWARPFSSLVCCVTKYNTQTTAKWL